MVHNDLRDWIDDLEERNDLKRITAEVHWDEEIGAITREISSQFGPALLFENIKEHRQTLCRRLFTNGTGTRERVCRLLGVSEKTSYRELVSIFKDRFSKPVKPLTVSKAVRLKRISSRATRWIYFSFRFLNGIPTMVAVSS